MSRRKKKRNKQQISKKTASEKSSQQKPMGRTTAMGIALRAAGYLKGAISPGKSEKKLTDSKQTQIHPTRQDQPVVTRSVLYKPKSVAKPQQPQNENTEQPKSQKNYNYQSNKSCASDERSGKQQFPNDITSEERDIVIGIDFGTSCTKIIIRDAVLRKAYAVPFDGISTDGYPYFLPSRIYSDLLGNLSLVKGELNSRDIKLNLMSGRQSKMFSRSASNLTASSVHLATSYLALAIREARYWFLNTYETDYKNKTINWHINIGVPSSTKEFKNMGQLFRKVALAAWQASTHDGRLNLDMIKNSVSRAEILLIGTSDINENEMHPDLVNSFPEVISEVVGYARSDMRPQKGVMYLLVDIGAGTMDVATFVLHKHNGIDRYSVLVNDVAQMGAMVLHRGRVDYIKKMIDEELSMVSDMPSEVIPIPDSNGYFMGSVSALVEEYDTDYLSECTNRIAKTLKDTKDHRNPLAVRHQDNFPIFICGGGSKVSLFKSAVEKSQYALGTNRPAARYLELPKPDQLDAPSLLPGDYHRVSVAFGLSHTIFEIGETVPPEDIEDITLSTKLAERPDRDEIYAK